MIEILIGLVILLALGLDYWLGRKTAYKAGHEAGYSEGNETGITEGKAEINDLKLAVGETNSPSVTQMDARVALAEMMRDSYKREVDHLKREGTPRNRQLKAEIERLEKREVELLAQINAKAPPVIGGSHQGVQY